MKVETHGLVLTLETPEEIKKFKAFLAVAESSITNGLTVPNHVTDYLAIYNADTIKAMCLATVSKLREIVHDAV